MCELIVAVILLVLVIYFVCAPYGVRGYRARGACGCGRRCALEGRCNCPYGGCSCPYRREGYALNYSPYPEVKAEKCSSSAKPCTRRDFICDSTTNTCLPDTNAVRKPRYRNLVTDSSVKFDRSSLATDTTRACQDACVDDALVTKSDKDTYACLRKCKRGMF